VVPVEDQVFLVDTTDGGGTQIHPSAAFDGEMVWLTYNRPDPSGGFDVWATRIGCDTTPAVPPFRVNTTNYNDVDPDVAVHGDRVVVAWQTDTGEFPANMKTVFRVFQGDGTPVMAQDAVLQTTRLGQPVTGNHWMPSVAGWAGGFALAGARGVDGMQGFQVFLQRVTRDGVPAGEAVEATYTPTASQTYPAVAALPDGTLHLAYNSADPADADDQVVHTTLAPGATAVSPSPPAAMHGRTQGSGADVAVGRDGRVYVAFADPVGDQVVLTDGALFGPAPSVELGTGGKADFAPTLAPAVGGGALAWHQNVSGYRNKLYAQPFRYDGTTFTPGTPVLVTPQTVPPYAPAITHVQEDLYFLAWSEGTNPNFLVKGVFTRLP
jgi:hypothetical protein